MASGRYMITEWDNTNSIVDVIIDNEDVMMTYCDTKETHHIDMRYFKLLSPVKSKE